MLFRSLLFGSFVQNYRNVRYLFVPYIIRGIGDILIALLTPLPFVLVILFIYGLNTSIGMVVYNSIMQSQVPETVRGRIYTLMDFVWNFMQLISLVLGGVFVDRLGIQTIYYIGGTLLIVTGVLGLALLGDYRFERPPE